MAVNECTEAEDLQKIQNYHDEAFSHVSRGLAYEEQKENERAVEMYRRGLAFMDIALNIRCDRPHCTGPKWDKARTLQQKMRKNMQIIKGQLEKLSDSQCQKPCSNGIVESPPSYDEACEQESFSFTRRASCPSTSRSPRNSESEREFVSEVTQVFQVPNGVQLFFVSAEGSVSTPLTPTSLHVYKFDNENKSAAATKLPSAWLQVGSWTYPLVPGQSPVLESGYGAFIFPDVSSEQDTAAVGIILPADVDFNQRREFEAVLASLTAFEEEKSKLGKDQDLPTSTFSDSLSRGLVIGAEYLSAGIVKGATVTGEYIHKGAVKLKERLQPEQNPATFDPRVKEGLRVAKTASGVALKASGFLVCKLGELTVALGRKIAPHVREQGTKLISKTFKSDAEQAKSTVDGVVKVAAGGVQGFSTVYMGLENAARILAYSLSAETVNVIGHKYGPEAAEVVGNAVFSVGNLALTTHNVHTLGIKSVAKKTAKDAGKAVLKDYAEKIDNNESSHEALKRT